MAGRLQRSGGQNKIDPRLHLLRGSYRPERHQAELLARQPLWAPQPAQLAALGPAGRAFVARLRTVYDLVAIEGELLLEAAVAVDRLGEIRETRVGVTLKERLALDKTEQWWQRQLSQLLLALRVRA